jgi:hypothetical protein
MIDSMPVIKMPVGFGGKTTHWTPGAGSNAQQDWRKESEYEFYYRNSGQNNRPDLRGFKTDLFIMAGKRGLEPDFWLELMDNWDVLSEVFVSMSDNHIDSVQAETVFRGLAEQAEQQEALALQQEINEDITIDPWGHV